MNVGSAPSELLCFAATAKEVTEGPHWSRKGHPIEVRSIVILEGDSA